MPPNPLFGGLDTPVPPSATEEGLNHTTTSERTSTMCPHKPRCPDAEAADREAAKSVRRDDRVGVVELCNGVLLWDDTGELLPSGRIIPPRRPTGSAA